MRTFINSRAMAITLALQTIDDEGRRPPQRARRRIRTRHAADRRADG